MKADALFAPDATLAPPIGSPCSWCGEPSIDNAIVAPEETTVNRKSKRRVLKKRAILAPVCKLHGEMVDRSNRCVELRELIEKRERSVRKLDPESKRGRKAARELERFRNELRELEDA